MGQAVVFGCQIVSLGKFEWKDTAGDFTAEGRRKILNGMKIAADDTAGLIQEKILGGPKTGKLYKKNNPDRVHRASAPGQYPATDKGTLDQSYGVEEDENSVYLITNAAHGPILEQRTGPGRRPHITRGVEENHERIVHIVNEVVQRK